MKTNTLLDEVSVDYSGWSNHPICSALVSDSSTPFAWLESVSMLGYYCESDDHEDDCECVTEETLKEAFLTSITERGLYLVDDRGRRL